MAHRTVKYLSWEDTFSYVTSVSLALQVLADDGDKEIKALLPPVEKLETGWAALETERRGRLVDQLRANVVCKRRDQQGDTVVQALHNDTLSRAQQKRTTPFFKRLFPVPVNEVIRMSLASELPEWKDLQRKLSEPEIPAELKKTHEAGLKSAITRGEAALTQREAAASAVSQTASRIEAFREDTDRTMHSLAGQLMHLQATRGEDKEWLDSFFPPPPKPTKSKKAATPDPQPPEDAAPNSPPKTPK